MQAPVALPDLGEEALGALQYLPGYAPDGALDLEYLYDGLGRDRGHSWGQEDEAAHDAQLQARRRANSPAPPTPCRAGVSELFSAALGRLTDAHTVEVTALAREILRLRGELAGLQHALKLAAFQGNGGLEEADVGDLAEESPIYGAAPSRPRGAVPRRGPGERSCTSSIYFSAEAMANPADTKEDEVYNWQGEQEEDEGEAVEYNATLLDAWTKLVGKCVQAKQRNILWLKKVWVPSGFLMQTELNRFDREDLDLGNAMRSHMKSAVSAGHGRFPGFRHRDILDIIPKSRGTLDPQSPMRLMWTFVGMVLMVYDLATLPLQAFSLPDSAFLRVVAWVSQVYWTVDIGFSCVTGVYIESRLEMRLSRIIRHYACTWLVPDLAITLPVWIVIIIDAEDSERSRVAAVGAARYIRMLRFLRLARIMKLEYLLNEMLAFINSNFVLISIKICKLLVGLVVLVHLNGCVWWAVGRSKETGSDGSTRYGWTYDPRFDKEAIYYQYISSCFWALTQFQGTGDINPGDTTIERAYAAVTLLMCMLVLSAFTSSLTNMMMQLQSLHNERSLQYRLICTYLGQSRVPMMLSVRVKKYVEWKQNVEMRQRNDEQVLEVLAPQLRMDVLSEVRGPQLCVHPLLSVLRDKYPRFLRRICGEAISQVYPPPREVVFQEGDISVTMYFVLSGVMSYSNTREKTLPEAVAAGDFLAEASIWMDWQHCGKLEMVSDGDGSLLLVDAERFGDIAVIDATLLVSLVLYARRFVAIVNAHELFTDLLPTRFMVVHEHNNRHSTPGDATATDSGGSGDHSQDWLSDLNSPPVTEPDGIEEEETRSHI